MSMRERWACPDLGVKRQEGMFLPVVGSSFSFDECPAYYLRTASMGLPAEHLIDGNTHPAQLVGEVAFEVESGARMVDTLSPKMRDLVHLYLSEKASRERHLSEMRREKARA
jgi:hypothetical protein